MVISSGVVFGLKAAAIEILLQLVMYIKVPDADTVALGLKDEHALHRVARMSKLYADMCARIVWLVKLRRLIGRG
jgi:hypothetical protein